MNYVDGKYSWNLAQIDSITVSGELAISIFPPIGEQRVAFGMPEEPDDEDDLFFADPHLILPLSPLLTQSTKDGCTIYIINNHEELDMLLAK